jgi:hydroxyacylglutathione hydrolase
VSGDQAVLVDPQRDAWRFLAVAEARHARVTHVLETHVHNDYLSGALETRATTNAEIGAPAGGGYAFAHRPLAEGDEILVGDLRLVAMETPGHTPEHLSYAVYEGQSRAPTAVFTGGSLIVGSAGRTDLLGPDRTQELTLAQYGTMRRLATLPDATQVLPTHGGGSFCAAGAAGDRRTSTIGHERLTNPALRTTDQAAFVHDRLTGLLAYPAYYANMAPLNRHGPPVLGGPPEVPALEPTAFAQRADAAAWVIDARRRADFAAAHIPGSVNVELSSSFGTYVGWVVPFDARLALVLPEPALAAGAKAAAHLLRIGYDHVQGYLEGGIEAWRSEGRPVRSYPLASVAELCEASRNGPAPYVLDVRQPAEWATGRFAGSQGLFMGDLPHHLDEVPRDRETWVICASGQRASVAASLLDRAGVGVRLVAESGVDELLAVCPPSAVPTGAR